MTFFGGSGEKRSFADFDHSRMPYAQEHRSPSALDANETPRQIIHAKQSAGVFTYPTPFDHAKPDPLRRYRPQAEAA